ncbi:hypothetical protein ASPZODRAFT_140511 [Penicilliopsis zonata CBS 506.65]|uniref:Uncharacterized protein n=1 Tax=Penicilliopsis zonata CBS 506.65 TaxID=1073090 RepID=A0A1L9SM38_9EURO|nr:hypothetical protein ASPZODRAFT_140511 [Penicilliopsis zonata CBS 506.65]OJJ48193.1 hypothetical protein ASPZODRAFT_140511 [Penicilliopsis zonata CBS 506.65]
MENNMDKTVSKNNLTSRDFVPRGRKASSHRNTALFVGLRMLDCFLQSRVLAGAPAVTTLLGLFGAQQISSPGSSLSSYRQVLLAMLCTTAAKHAWFATCVTEEAWTVHGALAIGVYNITCNTLNNLLFLCTATSATRLPAGETLANPWLQAGVALFVLGIGAEWQCELQRRAFKTDARNRGKPFTQGLFALVRHPNYSGYTLWRGALGLATSGPLSGLLIAVFFAWDFCKRAIPALDEYCSKRYGAMWVEYKQNTRYRLIPGIL